MIASARQRVEKRGPRRDGHFARHTVDVKRDRPLGRKRKFFLPLASR
jgi:hypothetical protein